MSHINRKAKIFVNGVLAGTLEECINEKVNTFVFQYAIDYLKEGSPIGFHFPLTDTPYEFNELPPFFTNLASEGWLKEIQCKQGGVNGDDIFGLLLANGKELIGAVSIVPDY
jgi:serine/threonine-protein kinase HipA